MLEYLFQPRHQHSILEMDTVANDDGQYAVKIRIDDNYDHKNTNHQKQLRDWLRKELGDGISDVFEDIQQKITDEKERISDLTAPTKKRTDYVTYTSSEEPIAYYKIKQDSNDAEEVQCSIFCNIFGK